MNQKQRDAIFRKLHRSIEETAAAAASALASRKIELTYPPNAGLTSIEQTALDGLSVTPAAESLLRKVIADAASAPLFTLFTLLDGVTDPPGFAGEWPTFQIAETDEEHESDEMMLHDRLFETYWDWLQVRPKRDWRLDT